jgi:hypothetical protein
MDIPIVDDGDDVIDGGYNVSAKTVIERLADDNVITLGM